mmetsp:Transcript_68611/g.204157  ORF Transcript_68611/g.204157 Transcript_68611/m.204157 type:complete len:229 (-) Transcript_68611:64-750(-)
MPSLPRLALTEERAADAFLAACSCSRSSGEASGHETVRHRRPPFTGSSGLSASSVASRSREGRPLLPVTCAAGGIALSWSCRTVTAQPVRTCRSLALAGTLMFQTGSWRPATEAPTDSMAVLAQSESARLRRDPVRTRTLLTASWPRATLSGATGLEVGVADACTGKDSSPASAEQGGSAWPWTSSADSASPLDGLGECLDGLGDSTTIASACPSALATGRAARQSRI